MKNLRVALIYNAYAEGIGDSEIDHGGSSDLRRMIRRMARSLRKLGHNVDRPPSDDLFAFQRKLLRMKPDVVFNQYDDVVHGALYEMRVAALVRFMGVPITGSQALGLGLSATSTCAPACCRAPASPSRRARLHRTDQRRGSARLAVSVDRAAQPGTCGDRCRAGLDRREQESPAFESSRNSRQLQSARAGAAFSAGTRIQRGTCRRQEDSGSCRWPRWTIRACPEAYRRSCPTPPNGLKPRWNTGRSPSSVRPGSELPLPRSITDTAVRAFRAVGGWGYGRVDIRLDGDSVPAFSK